MTLWIVLAVIAAVVILVALIPVGVRVLYGEEGLRAEIKVLFFRYTFWPEDPEKKAKKKKEKKKKPPKGPPKKREKGGSVQLLKSMLPVALKAAGKLRRKLSVDVLELRVAFPGCDDPARAAIRYGQANAVLGSLWQPLNQAFRIKSADLHTEVDYTAQDYAVFLRCAISIRIGQAVPIAAAAGFQALGRYRKWKKQRKEMNQNGKSSDQRPDEHNHAEDP